MNFKEWLNEINYANSTVLPYYDPDKIYNKGSSSTAFVYTTDHELYYEKYAIHPYLLKMNYKLKMRYNYEDDERPWRTDIIKNGDLAGRVGLLRLWGMPLNSEPNELVSFWNGKKADYEYLLDECIAELLKKQIIKKSEFYISTPFGTRLYKPGKFDSNKKIPDKELADLHAQLHTMQPTAKKAAMEKLGVGAGGIKNPWQASLEKSGTINPGQKWWAFTSEGNNNEIL